MNDDSVIKEGEYHPAANDAMAWFKDWQIADPVRYMEMREAMACTALSGNRLAQICHGTFERLATGQLVSDRYLLGLCWFLRDAIGKEDEDENTKD